MALFGSDNNNASSPGGGDNRPRKAYDEQTLVPVTARMILNAADMAGDMLLEDGRELHMVKLVGCVREVDVASTCITYLIEDGSGLVEVKHWLDSSDTPESIQMRDETCQDNVYLRIIGKLKTYDGKKSIVANSVRKITTPNELTHHFLEVVYSAERSKQKKTQQAGSSYTPYSVASNNEGVGFGKGPSTPGLVPITERKEEARNNLIHDFIKEEGGHTETGLDMETCVAAFVGRYSEEEIRNSITSLTNEGLLYSTVDADHFQSAMC
mmetsp:Transcript_7426/g.13354  ORF Transcript_7426/g.13354 Transcript_7426/m.13354 type:complete len:268 (-) Transcript_7426:321-1124(-)|eukprot:CAMPEP_0198293806 /NCGR_PEP_ID=MMETSP1449-20131203/18937_1 /TAXON_ID=420275 /ORGANISM="Attheya septentrionalis, Strain CCMP2084" /LENGTH=267 /DNA_ID=CAMNT_0043993529 /DNA_START=54 /DNA_END=857 /DNA_ORIENTATION=+